MTDPKRLPSMTEGLEYIKSRGVPIDFVVDVGVMSCTFSLIVSFAKLTHVLVEPVRAYHNNIRRIYASHDISYRLFDCAAGAQDGSLTLCEYARKGGTEVTHSQIVQNISEASQQGLLRTVEVDVRRVDSILRECTDCGLFSAGQQFLLKLDVDGAEESIVDGSRSSLASCSVVVIEVPMRKINARLQLLAELGFELMDMVDPCYYRGALSQVDCIFVRSDLVNRYGVDPWRVSDAIDFSQWYEGSYQHA